MKVLCRKVQVCKQVLVQVCKQVLGQVCGQQGQVLVYIRLVPWSLPHLKREMIEFQKL